MMETDIIGYLGGYLINDLLGGYLLAVLFIVIVVFLFMAVAKVPKAAWLLFPTILIMGFINAGMAEQWIGALLWIGLGLVWGIILKKVIS